MTEQQYRVIADRDKGDDPQWDDVAYGDRYLAEMTDEGDFDRILRIERPVPTTDEPMQMCDCGAPLAVCAAAFGCKCEPPSPHPLTREQVESAVGAVLFNASNYPRPAIPHILGQDIAPLRAKVTDAVLALIQNGADRG